MINKIEGDFLFTEKEIKAKMMDSFHDVCGIYSFTYLMSLLPKETKEKIEDLLIKSWKDAWKKALNESLKNYNNVLNEVNSKNIDKLPQPEDYQVMFNKIMNDCEIFIRETFRKNNL